MPKYKHVAISPELHKKLDILKARYALGTFARVLEALLTGMDGEGPLAGRRVHRFGGAVTKDCDRR